MGKIEFYPFSEISKPNTIYPLLTAQAIYYNQIKIVRLAW